MSRRTQGKDYSKSPTRFMKSIKIITLGIRIPNIIIVKK